MEENRISGSGDGRSPEHGDHQHDQSLAAEHHHHHRGRGGRPGRRPHLQALLSDQPTGTTAEELAEAFLRVGQLLRARARSHRGGQRRVAGLTFARAALLAAVDTDGPQRMGELAHRLGVVPRTVTPMVDALEEEGLLVRDPDPDDRRATLLRITDAGVAELSRTRSDRRSAVDEVFASLSDDERSGLAAALDKLRSAARAGLDPAAVEMPSDGLHGDTERDRHHGPRHGRGRRPQRREHHHGFVGGGGGSGWHGHHRAPFGHRAHPA